MNKLSSLQCWANNNEKSAVVVDEVVEVVNAEFLGYLDFLVGDGAQAAVFHADHDDRAGETVAVQGQEVHLPIMMFRKDEFNTSAHP